MTAKPEPDVVEKTEQSDAARKIRFLKWVSEPDELWVDVIKAMHQDRFNLRLVLTEANKRVAELEEQIRIAQNACQNITDGIGEQTNDN